MADETVLRIKERIRQEMRDLLGVTMADGGAIDRQALPAQIDSVAHEVCADFGISDENWIGYIIKSTIDDFIGLGPLQPLQDDPKVAEIFIDPVGVEPNGTFITPVARAEVDGQIVDCPGIDLVSHDEVGRLIGRIAEEANRRCDDSFPEMDATLADGSRVHAAHPKVSPNGWSLNIRKFSKDKLTAEDLLERGAMSEPMYMFLKGRLDSVAGTDEYEATKEELCDDFFAAASQASQATDFIIDRYEQEVGHPAAGKEIVQKLDMPEKTEQEDRADRSLSHKKETARDASAHMQGDRADLVNMRDENAIGA